MAAQPCPTVMFHKLLYVLLCLSLVFLTASSASAAPSFKLPSTLDEAIKMGELSWDTGILGVALIASGVLLLFSGKRFFKIFLGTIGFLVGSTFGSISFYHINDIFNFSSSNLKYWFYGVAIVFGLLGAVLCVTFWKIGVYAAAGFGGYMTGTFLLSLKEGGLISDQVGALVFLSVAIAIPVVLTAIFEHVVMIFSSSAVGSTCIALGVDCFLNWGLKIIMLEAIMSQHINLNQFDSKIYYMLGGMVVLTALGIFIQMRSKATGYGRAL